MLSLTVRNHGKSQEGSIEKTLGQVIKNFRQREDMCKSTERHKSMVHMGALSPWYAPEVVYNPHI